MNKIKSKFKESFKKGFWTGTGFAVAILSVSLFAIAVSLPHTWKSGDVLSSKEMNENFNTLAQSFNTNTQIVVVPNASFTGTGLLYTGFQSGAPGANSFSAIESSVQFVMPRPATIKNLRIRIISNQVSSPMVFTIRKNGIPTACTITIPALGAGIFYSYGEALFNTNDFFSIEESNTATGPSVTATFELLYEVL